MIQAFGAPDLIVLWLTAVPESHAMLKMSLKPFCAAQRKEYCWPCVSNERARHRKRQKGIA
jgi:hypothetical protein